MKLFSILLIISLSIIATNALVDIEPPTIFTPQGIQSRQDNIAFGNVVMSAGSFTSEFSQQTSGINSADIGPCQWHFWSLDATQFNDLNPGDYLHIVFNRTHTEYVVDPSTTIDSSDEPLTFYIQYGALPTEDSYLYRLDSSTSTFRIMELWPCDLTDTGVYWIGIRGPVMDQPGSSSFASNILFQNYEFEVKRRRVIGDCAFQVCDSSDFSDPIPVLPENVLTRWENNTQPSTTFDGSRPSSVNYDTLRNYRYFAIDVPTSSFHEGAYIQVNISYVETNAPVSEATLDLRLRYGSIPAPLVSLPQRNSAGTTGVSCAVTDECYNNNDDDYGTSGALTAQSTSCTCTPDANIFGWPSIDPSGTDGRTQYTCSIRVSPCYFRYSDSTSHTTRYYGSIELPANNQPDLNDPVDWDLYDTSFSISWELKYPEVTDVVLSTFYPRERTLDQNNFILYDDHRHYRLTLDSVSTAGFDEGVSNLLFRVSNVVGAASINVYYHYSDGSAPAGTYPERLLAGSETNTCSSCYDSTLLCSACAACNGVIPRCQLAAGVYYFSVEADPNTASINRLPVRYSLMASLFDDPSPVPISAGVPQFGQLAERMYDFYVLDVPETVDTWLFVEMYANRAQSPISVSVLSGSMPGYGCYAEPDMECSIGIRSGDYDSCAFMVDTCHLEEGQLYVSVYGRQKSNDNTANTYYAEPTDYTLWVEFETAWQIENNITYSEVIRTSYDSYNHYYLRADNVVEGSWLTVEIDNIRPSEGAGTVDVNAFINYNFLAGECPCYESLFNCTGSVSVSGCGSLPGCTVASNLDSGITNTVYSPVTDGLNSNDHACCKLYVDACSFRSGIWYVGVRAYGESERNYVGYTMTAIVHAPPPVYSLPIGQQIVDWVSQSAQGGLNHYRIESKKLAGSNLVIRLVWAIDKCSRSEDYLTGHISGGSLKARLATNHLAWPGCFDEPWACEADEDSNSQCTIIVPDCVWMDDVTYFLSIEGSWTGTSAARAQYTLSVDVESEPVTELPMNTRVHASLLGNRYAHFTVPVDSSSTPADRSALRVAIYWNKDSVDTPTASNGIVYFNVDQRAGGAREDCYDCYNAIKQCTDPRACVFNFDPCDLETIGDGVYYFSLYNPLQDFFGTTGVEFTIEATWWNDLWEIATDNTPVQSVLYNRAGSLLGDYATMMRDSLPTHHYFFNLDTVAANDYVRVILGNIETTDNGRIFFNKGSRAGYCPCYDAVYQYEFSGGSDCTNGNNVELVIPPCYLSAGTWYIAIIANQPLSSVSERALGYTLSVLHGSIPTNTSTSPGPTNTNAQGTPFNLGYDLPGGLQLLDFDPNDTDDIDGTFDDLMDWNPNNSFNNQNLGHNERRHYVVTVNDMSSALWISLDNVNPQANRLHQATGTDYTRTEVTLYFVGRETGTTGFGVDYQADEFMPCEDSPTPCVHSTLCSAVDQNEQCLTQLPPCLLSDPGDYYFIAVANTQPQNGLYTDAEDLQNRLTFDLKFFLQSPISLSAGESAARNISHPYGIVQRFQLPSVQTDGYFPWVRVVVEDVEADDIQLWLTSAGQAGNSDCNSGDTTPSSASSGGAIDNWYTAGNCLSNLCTENKNGIPRDNVIGNSNGFSSSLGRCNQGGTCTFMVPACVVAAQPSGDWSLTITGVGTPQTSSTAGVRYLLWWEQSSDASPTITTYPGNFINSRSAYPTNNGQVESSGGTPDATAQGTTEREQYRFWQISLSDIAKDQPRQSTGNSTVDNDDYVRLEIQTYLTGTADSIVWIGLGNRDSSSSNQVIVNAGVPPVDSAQVPFSSSYISSHGATANSQFNNAGACGCARPDTYVCRDNTDCSSRGRRFVAPACYLSQSDYTFWIVLRQLTDGQADVYFRTRLISEKPSGGDLVTEVDVDDLPTDFVNPAPGEPLLLEGITAEDTGIEQENYIHYFMYIPDNSYFYDNSVDPPIYRSLIFNMTTDDDSSGSVSLGLYISRGKIPGGPLFGLERTAFASAIPSQSPTAEVTYIGCRSSAYNCFVTNSNEDTTGGRCVVEIPSCGLSSGDWYFSVYNNAYQTDNVDDPTTTERNDNYQGYRLQMYFRPEEGVDSRDGSGEHPAQIDSDVSTCINGTYSGFAPLSENQNGGSAVRIGGVYTHFLFEITDSDLDAAAGSCADDGCRWEQYLRIDIWNYLRSVTSSQGSIAVYMHSPRTLDIQGTVTRLNAPAGESGFRPTNIDSDIECLSSNVPGMQGDVINLPGVVGSGVATTYEMHPCPRRLSDPELRAGLYYLSIRHETEVRVDVCATLVHPNFQRPTLSTSPISPSYQDETNTYAWSTVTYEDDVTDDTDNFRDVYISYDVPSSLMSDSSYLQLNITGISATSGLDFEMWRNDCQRFDCLYSGSSGSPSYDSCFQQTNTGTGSLNWSQYVFDAVGMAPCSVRGGSYWLHIRNPNLHNFTVDMYLRNAITHSLDTVGSPITSSIWRHQYHVYSVDVSDLRGQGTSLVFDVSDVSCGSVEVYAKRGTPAGPPYMTDDSQSYLSGFEGETTSSGQSGAQSYPIGAEKCSQFFCSTSPDDVDSCRIFIDSCSMAGDQSSNSALWYFTVRGRTQEWTRSDTIAQPVLYTVSATAHRASFNSTGLQCGQPISYYNQQAYDCDFEEEEDADVPPQQFTVDIETMHTDGSLRFTLITTFTADDSSFTPQLYVSQNASIPHSAIQTSVPVCGQDAGGSCDSSLSGSDYEFAQCSDLYYVDDCSISFTSAGATEACSVEFISNPCSNSEPNLLSGRWYIWALGRQGHTNVFVETWEPYVPIIVPGVMYSGSVNDADALIVGDRFNSIYRPSSQFYRFSTSTSPANWWLRVRIDFWNGQLSAEVQSINRSGLKQSTFSQEGFGCVSLDSLSDSGSTSPLWLSSSKCLFFGDEYWLTISTNSQDCSSSCRPVTYSFTIWTSVDVQDLECGVAHCDELDPEYTFAGSSSPVFDFYSVGASPSFARNTAHEGSYTIPGFSAALRLIDDSNDRVGFPSEPDESFTLAVTDNLVTSSSSSCVTETSSSLSCDDNLGGEGVWEDFGSLCVFSDRYLTVESAGQSTISPYQIRFDCTDYDATNFDVTLGRYTSTQMEGLCNTDQQRFIYSTEVPDSLDTSAAFLFVQISSTTNSQARLYINSGSPADGDCYDRTTSLGSTANSKYLSVGSCDLSNDVYYFTVYAQGEFTLEVEWMEFDPVELTLFQSSPQQTIPSSRVPFTFDGLPSMVAVYSFEVTAAEVSRPDSYITVQIRDIEFNVPEESAAVLRARIQRDYLPPVDTLESAPLFYPPLDAYGRDSGCYLDEAASFQSYEDIDSRKTSYLDHTTSSSLTVSYCDSVAGTYYVIVQSGVRYPYDVSGLRYRLYPEVRDIGIVPGQIDVSSGLFTNSRLNIDSMFSNQAFHFFEITGISQSSNSLGQVRLIDVRGGELILDVNPSYLPARTMDYSTNQYSVDTTIVPLHGTNHHADNSCNEYASFCTTLDDRSLYDMLNNDGTSCTVNINSCVWSTASVWYAGVSSYGNMDSNVPASYVIEVRQWDDWPVLDPLGDTGSFPLSSVAPLSPRRVVDPGNWNHEYFQFSTGGEVTSIVIDIEVSSSNSDPEEGVWVFVMNDRCGGSWARSIWCSAEYEDWVCEIEISDRASHPFSTDFFIDIYGKHTEQFSISYSVGTDNCQMLSDDSAASFCANVVDYPVWSWQNLRMLDEQASCFYEELLWRFALTDVNAQDCVIDDCIKGASSECMEALVRFACFESFRACDASGFRTSTCLSACSEVEYHCENLFASVDLEHFACTSSRYIDDSTGETCSKTMY